MSVNLTTCRIYSRQKSPNLLNYAIKAREKNWFNDLIINVDNRIILANRLVLASFSKFFEILFKIEVNEIQKSTVTIKTMSFEILKTLVDFIYDGKILIRKNNVLNILSGADFLQLLDVKEFCFDFLRCHLQPNCCFTIFKYAFLYRSDLLLELCRLCIKKDFEIILRNEEFRSLTKEAIIISILQATRYQLSDDKKYRAITWWIAYDEKKRKSSYSELLEFINVYELPCSFIKNVFLKHEIFTSNISSLRSVTVRLLQEIELHQFGKKLIGIGGKETPGKVFEIFNPFHLKKVDYPKLPYPVSGNYAVRLCNAIYSFGGMHLDVEKLDYRCWQMKLDVLPLRWNMVSSMKEANCKMVAALFKNTIVSSGGSTTRLSSNLIYVPEFNEWTELHKLKEERRKHQLVNLNEVLYALGGCDHEGKVLSSVECLPNLKRPWKKRRSMNSKRKHFAAVSYNQCIYAIGGSSKNGSKVKEASSREGEDFLKTVEKYDLKSNTWTYVTSLNVGRKKHSAVVFRDRIFVVGGYTMNGNPIEAYDSDSNCWTIVKECDQQYIDFSLIVI